MSRTFLPHVITDDSALGGSVIQKSVRFDSQDGQLFYRTNGTSTSQYKFTYSVWVKLNRTVQATTDYGELLNGYDGNNNNSGFGAIYFYSGQLRFAGWSGSYRATERTFRDPSSWYHIIVAVDSTLGTADNRQKIYVNGVEETNFSSSNNLGQNDTFGIGNNSAAMQIGRDNDASSSRRFDGYMAEINYIDGQQLDASYFGFTDPVTNTWMPKRYEGTYGTNGFYLDFSDNSSTAALGIDKSPNGNDFTANNYSVSAGIGNDSLEDTPTNNFCTINSLDMWRSSTSASEGNLKFTRSASNFGGGRGSLAVKSGKWYFEFTKGSGLVQAGFCNVGFNIHYNSGDVSLTSASSNASGIAYDSRGFWYGYTGSNPSSIDDDDVIGVAFDADNFKFYFHKNGTYYGSGNPSTGTNGITANHSDQISYVSGTYYAPYFNAENGNGYANFGQRPFSYSIPTGYRTLCSKNLPPNVSSITKPQRHFESLIYTGDNSSDRDITGLEFKPDFVWIKNRSAGDWNILTNSVAGANRQMYSNETDGESEDNSNGHVNYYINGGFNVDAGAQGNVNENSENYASWCWKAGGNSHTYNIDGTGYATAAAAGLDGGTIDPTGSSINTKSGFSIITYTGNGSAGATVAHGLGKKPAWIIIKRRDAVDNWMVYHKKANVGVSPEDYYAELNSNSADINSTVMLNDTAPTSTLITLGSDNSVNGNTATYVMYCWSEIPGFSKFGTYKANGNGHGPYVSLGFRPAWVLIKNISLGQPWVLIDNKRETYNEAYTSLGPSTSAADYESKGNNGIDFLADGFKIRGHGSGDNNYSSSYPNHIYMAFAEAPSITPFDTFPNAR